MKRIDKIWTTSKRKQSFYTCTCINSSSHIRVFFLTVTSNFIFKKMKISFHQSHLSSKKFNLFRNPSLFFLKMSLSYKHIKIITQLKISIQKSNNKHIFVVKFKHMDITYFNNLKKKIYELSIHWKRPQNQQMQWFM